MQSGLDGAWNDSELLVTCSVGQESTCFREFTGGSAVVLRAEERGKVLNSSAVLLCALVGADGKYVLRAIRASDWKRAWNKMHSEPLTAERERESVETGLNTLALGPPTRPLTGEALIIGDTNGVC